MSLATNTDVQHSEMPKESINESKYCDSDRPATFDIEILTNLPVKTDNNNQQGPRGREEQKKVRRSSNARRQKRLPIKASSQQRSSGKFVLKSQIPRAILASARVDQSSGSAGAANAPFTMNPVVHFRTRKSVSQIDLKQIQRIRRIKAEQMVDVQLSSGTDLMKTGEGDVSQYFYTVSGCPERYAGLKIFATVMLNAWRNRRAESKRLKQEINDLKRYSIKTKNQIHVLNTLFHVEQKRNDELSLQIKRALDEANGIRGTCENLTTSLITIKADKALLEQQLVIKMQEYDGLNAILIDTDAKLTDAIECNNGLRSILDEEQRKLQDLEDDKCYLTNEIDVAKKEFEQYKIETEAEIEAKSNELRDVLAQVKLLEDRTAELKKQNEKLAVCAQNEIKLKRELEALKAEALALRECLNKSFCNRVDAFWKKSRPYQQIALLMGHWVAFYILPATPMPRIGFPISFSFRKALRIKG